MQQGKLIPQNIEEIAIFSGINIVYVTLYYIPIDLFLIIYQAELPIVFF